MRLAIETGRMLIRQIQESDAEGMFTMDTDPDVHIFLGNKPFKTIEESKALIRFIRQQYVENGIGRWAMEDKTTKEFVGWVGFRLMKEMINGHSNYLDFGYRLRQKYWGKGYATEAAKAALDYGINTLKLENIHAMTDVNNFASKRVLEKIGFIPSGLFPYDGQPTWRTPGEMTAWFEL
jgi:[ribosomal protein S5]-alanine N-acetyltransferase